MDRFKKLLHLLGNEEKTPSFHRGNLIHAILDFAVLNKGMN